MQLYHSLITVLFLTCDFIHAPFICDFGTFWAVVLVQLILHLFHKELASLAVLRNLEPGALHIWEIFSSTSDEEIQDVEYAILLEEN